MDGLLKVDKPAGWTSHDAVAYVKRALGARKAGHTGTLDPAATGLLLVLVGRATRLARYFEADTKSYTAELALGTETDTQDAEGEVTGRCDVPELRAEGVLAVLEEFKGEIVQTPPMYSAVKVDGRPLYSHARAGREVERSPRSVTVHDIALSGITDGSLSIVTTCSKGTYIRTLGRDIARALGTCGHLSTLRRTAVGIYGVEDAVELAGRPGRDELARRVTGLDEMLREIPAVRVIRNAGDGVLNGRAPLADDLEECTEPILSGKTYRLLSAEGRLLAVARAEADAGGGDAVLRLEVVLS